MRTVRSWSGDLLRVPTYPWQYACDAALTEADPDKFSRDVGLAVIALEKRCADWGTNPGSETEVRLIAKMLSSMSFRIAQECERRRLGSA